MQNTLNAFILMKGVVPGWIFLSKGCTDTNAWWKTLWIPSFLWKELYLDGLPWVKAAQIPMLDGKHSECIHSYERSYTSMDFLKVKATQIPMVDAKHSECFHSYERSCTWMDFLWVKATQIPMLDGKPSESLHSYEKSCTWMDFLE